MTFGGIERNGPGIEDQGHPARPHSTHHRPIWSDRHARSSRLQRRARVTSKNVLTSTGTILLQFEVVDDMSFRFAPGQFVAVDFVHPSLGYRRSPYCLYDASEDQRRFELLVRVVPQGPVSVFLGDLEVGDVIGFRGPTGHSMLPGESETHLILLATGVGFGPCHCLLRYLSSADPRRRVSLFWGLRLEDDVCLLDELIALDRMLPNFDWNISLSEPSGEWPPLRGRVTQSVPPTFETLADKHFYLTSNGGMVAEFSAALQEVGVPRERIYEESFFDHRNRPSSELIQTIVDRFRADDLRTPLLFFETVYGWSPRDGPSSD